MFLNFRDIQIIYIIRIYHIFLRYISLIIPLCLLRDNYILLFIFFLIILFTLILLLKQTFIFIIEFLFKLLRLNYSSDYISTFYQPLFFLWFYSWYKLILLYFLYFFILIYAFYCHKSVLILLNRLLKYILCRKTSIWTL